MIASVQEFLNYYQGVRRRTLNYCRVIPAEWIDWAPRPEEFTCGDIIRHLAGSEQMFTGVAVTDRWAYPGHERQLGPTLADALAYLEATHTSVVAALGTLTDNDLYTGRTAIDGRQIAVWRVLMMMVEHEAHHRSQLASYLSELGIEPPQIYGMTLEQVLTRTEVRER